LEILTKIKHSVGLTCLACHARRSRNVSLRFSNSSPKENTAICQQFLPLVEARAAFHALEGCKTIGKVVLIPGQMS
jgi:hypothetical protein